MGHDSLTHKLKHFVYAGGWKKFEPIWNFLIKTKNLNHTLPLLEGVLTKVRGLGTKSLVVTDNEKSVPANRDAPLTVL